MKVSEILFCFLAISLLAPLSASGQSATLPGTWQLVKEGTCMEETASIQNDTDSAKNLRKDMSTRAGATARIVTFRPNSSGEESVRILNTRRTANPRKFFYKFNGEMLLILDKKTQTISASYLVEKFTADSLILSNAARPCEVRILVRTAE